jgi:septum formation protein
MSARPVILGSRSPRRRELLRLLVPDERLVVRPPRSSDEAGFDELRDRNAIAARLLDVVRAKQQDVDAQLTDAERRDALALVADTIIVAAEPDGSPVVLGQPPETPDGNAVVQRWFERYYSGRTHEAWTGVCLWTGAETVAAEIVSTAVTFRAVSPDEVEWYLTTGEPRGKAGGYALQGLASLFVARVEGSLTNVVGLPLEVVRRVLATWDASGEHPLPAIGAPPWSEERGPSDP